MIYKKKIIVIKPQCADPHKAERLNDVLEYGLQGYDAEVIADRTVFQDYNFHHCRILFAVSLGESGINLEFYHLLKWIRTHPHLFDNSVAGVVVDGNSELYTKAIARELLFTANMAGCTFPGRPLVEGTATLFNFTVIAKNLQTSNEGAYRESVRELVHRVVGLKRRYTAHPKLLVLHAGNAAISNTLALWNMVETNLDATIRQISLRNGEIRDCRGCSYETCLHFGEKSKCFYGGVITKEVYPAILECDGLIMICPNYNDAVGANLTAFINRLTAIFRVHRFFDTRLYSIIVSGYSGSDLIAEQLISSLNMNKTFLLPPRFALMKTANDPGSIRKVKNIEEQAAAFSRQIMAEFQGCQKSET